MFALFIYLKCQFQMKYSFLMFVFCCRDLKWYDFLFGFVEFQIGRPLPLVLQLLLRLQLLEIERLWNRRKRCSTRSWTQSWTIISCSHTDFLHVLLVHFSVLSCQLRKFDVVAEPLRVAVRTLQLSRSLECNAAYQMNERMLQEETRGLKHLDPSRGDGLRCSARGESAAKGFCASQVAADRKAYPQIRQSWYLFPHSGG